MIAYKKMVLYMKIDNIKKLSEYDFESEDSYARFNKYKICK